VAASRLWASAAAGWLTGGRICRAAPGRIWAAAQPDLGGLSHLYLRILSYLSILSIESLCIVGPFLLPFYFQPRTDTSKPWGAQTASVGKSARASPPRRRRSQPAASRAPLVLAHVRPRIRAATDAVTAPSRLRDAARLIGAVRAVAAAAAARAVAAVG
jgi:hypothetical protein